MTRTQQTKRVFTSEEELEDLKKNEISPFQQKQKTAKKNTKNKEKEALKKQKTEATFFLF